MTKPIDRFSIQLYSARSITPLEAQFALLSNLGYTMVEPWGGLFNDPETLKKKLKAILLYHVVPKEVLAAQVPTKATAVPTLDGSETLTVRRHGKTVRVNTARVIKADVKADNGVIHVVDRVLLPK